MFTGTCWQEHVDREGTRGSVEEVRPAWVNHDLVPPETARGAASVLNSGLNILQKINKIKWLNWAEIWAGFLQDIAPCLARVVPPRPPGHAHCPAHRPRPHVSDQVLVNQPLPLLRHAHLGSDHKEQTTRCIRWPNDSNISLVWSPRKYCSWRSPYSYVF